MFKKTKVRSILELLEKNLSAREVSRVLGVSGNTAAEVQALFLQSGKSRDDISDWDGDRRHRETPLGRILYPMWKDRLNACSYITFARNYKKFTADKNNPSHIEHKPGLEIEVD